MTGCPRQASKDIHPEAAAANPCVSMESVLAGAATPACTLAERICLVVRDVPAAVNQADFVAQKSYAARWASHVSVWRTQLDAVAKEPALESFAHVAQKQLEWLDKGETDRRLVVENGDLVHALQKLVKSAKEMVPSPGLDCELP